MFYHPGKDSAGGSTVGRERPRATRVMLLNRAARIPAHYTTRGGFTRTRHSTKKKRREREEKKEEDKHSGRNRSDLEGVNTREDESAGM